MNKYGSYGIQHNDNARKKKSFKYSLLISIVLSILAIVWLIAEYKYDDKKQLFTLTDNVSLIIRTDENTTADEKKITSEKKITKKKQMVTDVKKDPVIEKNKITVKIKKSEVSNIAMPDVSDVKKTNTAKLKPQLLKITLNNGDSFIASENGVESDIVIEIENNKPSVAHIMDKISFAIDSYDLLPEAMAQINNVAKILNNYKDINILISGHTDNIGEKIVNKYFSLERAKAVRNYLIKKGISKSRIKVSGKGENYPIVPNTSRANRKINRRIDIKLIK